MWRVEYIFYKGDIMNKRFPMTTFCSDMRIVINEDENFCKKEEVNKFYEWFKESYEEDNDLVIKNKYTSLIEEYKRVKSDIGFYEKSTKERVSELELRLTQVNKIKKYLKLIKKEHEIINSGYDSSETKDIIYSNDILGWYEETPLDIYDAINNIYNTEIESNKIIVDRIVISNKDNQDSKNNEDRKVFIVNLTQGV